MPSTATRLLVAPPGVDDPHFARTVVFVVEHTAEGALGVVLNRPGAVTTADLLPEWSHLVAAPELLFVGGPVEPDGVILLARARGTDATDGWTPLVGRIGSIDPERMPDDVRPDLDAARAFVGYAGWGPGQLDGELARRGWYVVDVEPDDLLTDDPGGLWKRVLRRQGGELAMAANAPLDPSHN